MVLWFWWWLLFVFLLLIIPLSYGWGYRGWGAPYPTYYRRRRTASGDTVVEPAADPEAVAEEESTWGVFADVLWVLLIVALVWLVLALLL